MKIRAANIRDLGRIEDIHHGSDGQLSNVAPPARLWSLVSQTLSALLPLYQESLLFVAEEKGRVVGFAQASARQPGLNLPVKPSALQLLNLGVAKSADIGEVAPALVDHLCNQALQRGVHKLFVRLPLDDKLTPLFRLEGFRQYAIEHVLYSEQPQGFSAQVPFGLRPARGRDDRALYQMYRKVTPAGVALVEAPSFREFRMLKRELYGSLASRGDSDKQMVVDRVELVGWVRVQRSSTERPHTLSFKALPEADLPEELVDYALTELNAQGPAWSSLRHYDSHMIDALRGRGFTTLLRQALLVKELAVRVPVREKGLVPSFG